MTTPSTRHLGRDRAGAIAIAFALSMAPISILVALVVDYSFYIQAEAQLATAADAAALHAVRAASSAYQYGATTIAGQTAAGQQAGQQWFTAQLGTFQNGSLTASGSQAPGPIVSVVYSASPGGFTSTVTYTASVPTLIGGWLLSSWTLTGVATATITNSFVEIIMMIDNSSSMLLGASLSDMVALEKVTPCSVQSATAGQAMGSYTWNYPAGFGYPARFPTTFAPPASPVLGSCDSRYDGDPSACFYIPSTTIPISSSTGLCTNGGGSNGSDGQPVHTPEAPCSFACHYSSTNNDYYGLARSQNPPIQLRLDVVHQAAANVITSLQSQQQVANQFSVGVYEFNNKLTSVYPGAGGGEAATSLPLALAAVNTLSPPVTTDIPNTNFTTAVGSLIPQVSAAGAGTAQSAPLKNLFIITDGMSDTLSGPNQVLATFTNPANEQLCRQFKQLGFSVYVLYTPYLPIPVPSYLAIGKPIAEPTATSPIVQALQACASSTANFFQASSPAAINAAMQAMLLAAVNAPARLVQ